MQDSLLERLGGLFLERLRSKRQAEPTLKPQPVAGAAVLADQVKQLRLARRRGRWDRRVSPSQSRHGHHKRQDTNL